MNVEQLVRASLREQAADTASAPTDFADRVLAARRRRTRRTVTGVAAATVLVVAVAVGVPLALNSGDVSTQLASEASRGQTLTHVDQSPPRDLIAVGDQALAAYYTSRQAKQPNRDTITTRTYSLLDQRTGRYEVDARWSYLAVAPGMRTAAVLERELPAHRVGMLDLVTKKVTRWIPVEQGIGSLVFSPDGEKLLATTYEKNPDRAYWSKRIPVNNTPEPQRVDSRTGFAVIDLTKDGVRWTSLPTQRPPDFPSMGSGRPLLFNADGTLVYEIVDMEPVNYRDLQGKKVPTPPKEKHVDLMSGPAGLSPNGELVAGGFAGGMRTTATEVLDPGTGERVAKLKGQELLVWADDKRLIAWDIAPGGGEYDNRLVLITLGSDKVVSLSGARTPKDYSPGRWEPIFARR
ncbi:hypothetical protein [Streptomyces sp. NPDC050428]|uniref:hypothetical protein n=1 Tax=Streptomyces sp. NPDC050428 TaxID=3155757 RepID=UPI003419FFED